MQPELLRLGAHRLVDIHVAARPGPRYGSGYAIAGDLVLTAAHVVPYASRYLVRTLDYQQFGAELLWSDPVDRLDAALLRVAGAPWRDAPDRDSLRWGNVAGNKVTCWALGFPKAQQDAAGRRDVETMHGSIDMTTRSRARFYDIDVSVPRLSSAPEGRSWWQGMSGAALFGPGRELLGVIHAADVKHYEGSRLEAVRATRLLRNEEFSRLVGASSEDVEDVRDRGEVAELDGPDFVLPAYVQLPDGASDAQQLLAQYRVVPFLGRAAELGSLRDWCMRPDRFSVAVVTGDQGAGKTRLAAELCKELGGAGWSAGFMGVEAVNSFLTKPASIELVWPTLLVIDEPDRLTDQVMALIDRLCRRRRGARLRLLLLDRTPDATGRGEHALDHVAWWRKLNRRTEGLVAGTIQATIRLGAGRLTEPEQRRHMAQALATFGHDARQPRSLDLTDPNPLRLHLAVLNAVRGADHQAGDLPEKLLLNREADRWERLLAARSLGDLGEVRAHQALALASMTAPESAEAVELLTAIPALDAGDASRERRFQISEWLAVVYPGGRRLGMPSHSVVVEELLEDTPSLAEFVVALYDHPARTTRHLVTLLETLRLAAGRRGTVRQALYGLLSRRLAALLEAAAAEPDSQLPGMVDAALETVSAAQADGSLGAAAAALRHPQPSGQLGISQLRCRIIGLAVAWRTDQPAPGLALADAQTDLTAYRAALGDLAGARAAADAALSAYRRLPSVPEASLARAHGNLGICRALEGDPDNAAPLLEEAASRAASLADLDPAHLPGYVDALIGLSACQADQGHQVQAITTLRRALAASRWASGIGWESGILGGLIEPLGELAESLAGTPDLAPARVPDARCYRPPAGIALPSAQGNAEQLGTLLRLTARLTIGLAGRMPTARKNAVVPALVPALAREQARRSAWDYAEYLRALTQLLVGQNEFEYAIAAATESVALFRWAAAKEKDLGHKLRLPAGLRALAGCCYLAGRLDQAIGHADDAVAEYRLRARDAGFPVRMLAETLAERARYLQDADRLQEAIENRREALTLYRDLAARDDTYLPSVGDSQIGLGAVLLQAGEADEAAASLQEGAALLERLTVTQPELTERLMLAHALLADLAGVHDDSARSVDSARRAAELAEQNAAADPGRWFELAMALCMLSSSLELSSRPGESFEQADRAVSVVRERGTPRDDEARTLLGLGLSLMSSTAYAIGDLNQALATAQEAVSILTQVDDTGPEFALIFGSALTAQACALAATQRSDEAITAALRALDLFARPGADAGTGQIALQTAAAHVVLGMARTQLGRPDEALASARAAQAALREHAPGPTVRAQGVLAESYRCEGLSLVGLGRPDEAVAPLAAAAGLYETVVPDNRSVTLPLASTLYALGLCHQQLGHADFAVEHADRSITLLGDADQLLPSARTVLAQSLLLHAQCWGELGNDDAAHNSCTRILDLYRSDPPDDPAGLVALGTAMAMSGRYAWVQGDPDTAVSRLITADSILRDIEPDTGIALPLTVAHAHTMAWLAECHAAFDDPAAAAQTAADAMELLRVRQVRTQPPLNLMYGQLAQFVAQCLMQRGQSPADIIEEAIETFRSLTGPEATINLIQALNLRALHQDSVADTASAAESAAEAAGLCRQLTSESRPLPLVASTLNLLGGLLLALKRLVDALAPLQESASYLHDLAITPEYPAIDHLQVELRLGVCLTALERSSEAAEHFHTALDLLQRLAADDPRQSPQLAQAITLLSGQLINLAEQLDIYQSPILSQILDLNASILHRAGDHATAESIGEYTRRWGANR
jgi:tetratricopeptide (TPR) repeat protein